MPGTGMVLHLLMDGEAMESEAEPLTTMFLNQYNFRMHC